MSQVGPSHKSQSSLWVVFKWEGTGQIVRERNTCCPILAWVLMLHIMKELILTHHQKRYEILIVCNEGQKYGGNLKETMESFKK